MAVKFFCERDIYNLDLKRTKIVVESVNYIHLRANFNHFQVYNLEYNGKKYYKIRSTVLT